MPHSQSPAVFCPLSETVIPIRNICKSAQGITRIPSGQLVPIPQRRRQHRPQQQHHRGSASIPSRAALLLWSCSVSTACSLEYVLSAIPNCPKLGSTNHFRSFVHNSGRWLAIDRLRATPTCHYILYTARPLSFVYILPRLLMVVNQSK